MFEDIVLLTNFIHTPEQDPIIEDILWRSQIQIQYLPNTTNPDRRYSIGRIFCPESLQSLDAKLSPSCKDLSLEEIQKLRGGIVESLFKAHPLNALNAKATVQSQNGTNTTHPPNHWQQWKTYLLTLHTFLNYQAWLLWCAGDRSPLALQQNLLARPEIKLFYQKIAAISHEATPHCRFFPSPLAIDSQISHLEATAGNTEPLNSHVLETWLGLHPTRNSLFTLRRLIKCGFSLTPKIGHFRVAGHDALLVTEQGYLPSSNTNQEPDTQSAGQRPKGQLIPFRFVSQLYVINKPEGNDSNLQALKNLREYLPHIQLEVSPPEEPLEKTKHVPILSAIEHPRQLWTLTPSAPNSDNTSQALLTLKCPEIPFLQTDAFTRTSHLWRQIAQISDKTKAQRRLENQQIQEKVKNVPKAEIFQQIRNLTAWNPKGDLYEKTTRTPRQHNAKNKRRPKISDETWFPGRGNPQAPSWIIGLYPSNSEIESQPPTIFVGPSGIELSNQLQESGINEQTDIYIDNVLRKFEPPGTKPVSSKIQEQCWALKALICLYRPERLILLGADVLQVFAGKQISFTERRKESINITVSLDPEEAKTLGIPNAQHQLQAAATYHPAYILRSENSHALRTAREDMKGLLLGETVSKTGPPPLNARLCRDEQAFANAIKEILEQFDHQNADFDLGIDTEAETLDPRGQPISLQLAFCPTNPSNSTNPTDPTQQTQNNPINQVTALFLEKPEPLELTPEQVQEEVQQLEKTVKQDFEFSFVQALKNLASKTPLGPIQPDKPPLFAVAWKPEEKETHLRKAAQLGCGLKLFEYYARLERISPKSQLAAKNLLSVFEHPHCRKIAITNLNHDRAVFELSILQIDLTPFEPKLVDTIIAEHIRDESINERGLKATIERHLGWRGYEAELSRYAEENKLKKLSATSPQAHLRSPWSLYPWKIIEKYAALDPLGSALVYQSQEEDIQGQAILLQDNRPEHNITDAFYISMGAIHGIYEMQTQGMPLNETKFRALEDFYAKHEKAVITRYHDAIFRLTGEEGVNPRSDQQLAYLLFNKKSVLPGLGIRPWKTSGKESTLWDDLSLEEQETQTPSVDAESLEIIASSCPDKDIQKLLKIICDTKYILTLRDTFVVSEEKARKDKGMRGKINPLTGRLHTTYYPTLDTARCRSVPNLANIVRDEVDEVAKILGETPPCAIRDLVEAIPGYLFICRDWTTAEVLDLAYLSEDPTMLEIVSEMRNGQDTHALLSLEAFSQIRPFVDAYQSDPTIRPDQIELYINSTSGREEIILHYANRWGTVPEKAASKYVTSQKGKKKLKSILEKSGNRPLTYAPPDLTTGQIHQFIKKVFPDLRQNAKPVTFGVPYGRTAPQIQKQINRENYKNQICDADGNIMKISGDACENMVVAYKEKRFPVAWKFLTDTASEAKIHHQIQDRWGYIRHFPTGMRKDQLERKAYNWPIQHGVAVLMNQAMAEWKRRRTQAKLKSHLFYTLYDALGWHCPLDELQTVWTISAEIMTKERPALPDRPWCIPTDGKIKTNWESGDVELDKLSVQDDPSLNLTGLEK